MLIDPNQTLKDMLAADLPPDFVRTLLDQVPTAYREAHAAVKQNPKLGKWERRYLLGHQRRVHCEAMLRDSAVLHGLSFSMKKSIDQDGHESGFHHVRVTAGRFAFTECHVQSRRAFPKFSRSREQYSKINDHTAQGDLFSVQSEPREAELYGIIVHTEQRDDRSKLLSLALGFPDPEFKRWIQEPIPLIDICELQTAIQGDVESPEESGPHPKWKAGAKDGSTA